MNCMVTERADIQESMLLQLTMITKDLPSPCKNTLAVTQANKINWQLKQLISEVAKNKR